MVRRRLISAAIAAIVFGNTAVSAAADRHESDSALQFERSVVVLETGSGRHPITVEIADTPHERAQGLQYRRQLAANAGMLFDFSTPRRVAMWMKNTFISLDMIFLDDQGHVIAVETNTTPFSLKTLRSPKPARAVLEVNAGLGDKLDLRPGDTVCHAMFSRDEC